VHRRNDEFGDRPESHAAPVVVVAAPRRHAVEVAHVVDLRQREEWLPGQRDGVLDESAYLELPRRGGHVRRFAEIEDGPVLHFVLPDRELRHAVPIRGSAALRLLADELHVDGALVHLDVAFDELLPPLDEGPRMGLAVVAHAPVPTTTEAARSKSSPMA